MNINFAVNLPAHVEERLRTESGDVSAAAREGFAIELFRRGVLSHYELGRSLGLDRFETDALLKCHMVAEHALTHEDVDADLMSIDEALAPANS